MSMKCLHMKNWSWLWWETSRCHAWPPSWQVLLLFTHVGQQIAPCRIQFRSWLFLLHILRVLQLPLFLWTAKTSVWRRPRTVACMRNVAPCGRNMWWPAPSEQQPPTTAVTARNATKPCGASWSACQRSTASPCSSVPALTPCVGSGGGKPSSRRVRTRSTGGGRRGWASPTASVCRTTAPEMSCVGKTLVWVGESPWRGPSKGQHRGGKLQMPQYTQINNDK